MRPRILLLIPLFAALIPIAGCVVVAPPPRPRAGVVWVPAHWRGGYWIRGHWT